MIGTYDKALIFINWNTGCMTLEAVRTAKAHAAHPERMRILIVDNGSTDDSLEKFARDLPEAEVVPMGENCGFARAANAGLRRVREPHAFVLNTDLVFESNTLDRLADALDQDPLAVLATPKLLRLDHSVQPAAVPKPQVFWELVNRSLPRYLMHVPDDRTSTVPGLVGACMAVHMKRVHDIGFLDERFFFFMEETDWCTRVNQVGKHVLYVPSAEVVHVQGETANRRPARARIQFYSSRYRYFRKHAGIFPLGVLFTGLWLRLTLDLLLHSLLALATLGHPKFRDKTAMYTRLWLWHALFCPPRWGFEPPGWSQPDPE